MWIEGWRKAAPGPLKANWFINFPEEAKAAVFSPLITFEELVAIQQVHNGQSDGQFAPSNTQDPFVGGEILAPESFYPTPEPFLNPAAVLATPAIPFHPPPPAQIATYPALTPPAPLASPTFVAPPEAPAAALPAPPSPASPPQPQPRKRGRPAGSKDKEKRAARGTQMHLSAGEKSKLYRKKEKQRKLQDQQQDQQQ